MKLSSILKDHNIFITSDQHFGHANIIKHANRPYASVLEMDLDLIARWNSVVSPNDLVIHLGDFCLGNAKMAASYWSQLNGDMWILNNSWHHDCRWLPHFASIRTATGGLTLWDPLTVFNFDDHLKITVCHYPMWSWEGSYYGMPMFHGHTHLTVGTGIENSYNVCVEATDYFPVPLTNYL